MFFVKPFLKPAFQERCQVVLREIAHIDPISG